MRKLVTCYYFGSVRGSFTCWRTAGMCSSALNLLLIELQHARNTPSPQWQSCALCGDLLFRAHGANKGTSSDVRQLTYARACAFRYSTSFSPAQCVCTGWKEKRTTHWCSGLQYHCCLVAMTSVIMSRNKIISLFALIWKISGQYLAKTVGNLLCFILYKQISWPYCGRMCVFEVRGIWILLLAK